MSDVVVVTNDPAEVAAPALAANDGAVVADVKTPEPTAPTDASSVAGADADARTDDPAADGPTRLEKRFSTLTNRIKELETDRDRLIAESRRPAAQPEPQQAAKPAVDPNAPPDPNQYTDSVKWQQDTMRWAARVEAEKIVDAREQRAADDRIGQSWNAKLAAVKADLTDFEQVVGTVHVIIPDHLRAAIVESDIGPRVVYWLAKNPSEAQRIAALPPGRGLVELGKIEAGIATPAKPETTTETAPNAAAPTVRTTSKAPEPIAPIRGQGATADLPIGPNGEFKGTFEQYVKLREAGKIK